MFPKSDLLFPHRCVQALKNVRGPQWEALVRRIAALPETHEDSLAFALLMIRLADCLNCDMNSYRASLGCCTCAWRAVNSFKGSDEDLLRLFQGARREVQDYLKGETP